MVKEKELRGGKQVLGMRLKSLRESKGLSQEEAADMTGISSTLLRYYEKGTRVPTLCAIDELARVYGVTVDYLLHGERISEGSQADHEIRKRIC